MIGQYTGLRGSKSDVRLPVGPPIDTEICVPKLERLVCFQERTFNHTAMCALFHIAPGCGKLHWSCGQLRPSCVSNMCSHT